MTSLFDLFFNGKTIESSIPIKLPIESHATIYGFVAYDNYPFSEVVSCPPLGPAHIIANRIVFSMEGKLYRFPIFNKISKPIEEKYPVFLLYVPRLLGLEWPSHVSSYLSSMKNEKPDRYVGKVNGIQVIENKAYYFPKEDEYLFESNTQFRGIGNSFVIITRRNSPDNGVFIYEVWNPGEVKIIE